MLKKLPKYQNAEIVRTRDPAKLEECEIVVDVGGVFDLAKNRFDHHQRTFTDTFKSLVPSKPWEIKLSSAGLVYVYFGKEVITHIVNEINTEGNAQLEETQQLIDILYDKMYEQFVREIDAIDNGVEIGENKKYDITTNLSSRVGRLNPNWNEAKLNEDDQFKLALDLVGKEFVDRIRYYTLNWWPARSLVTAAIAKRFEIHPSGAIIVLTTSVPWKAHLFDLETELKITEQELKYAMYEDSNGAWRIQCVPINDNSFINRLSLPAEWCGVRDQELSTLANIPDCIFVHANGFIGGNKTYAGALQMLEKALATEEANPNKKLKC